jgi:hypothetical protein
VKNFIENEAEEVMIQSGKFLVPCVTRIIEKDKISVAIMMKGASTSEVSVNF